MSLRIWLGQSERRLARPAGNAQRTWTERSGVVFTLQHDDGSWGQGEASPLPGFSPDTIDDCRKALSDLDPTLLVPRLEPGMKATVELLLASSRLPAVLPAAKAALETALLDLWARAAGKPAWTLLTDDPAPPSHSVAALLSDLDTARVDAERALARGIRTFKLKVGRAGAEARELEVARQLRALGPELRLRLDANRAWSTEQAVALVPRFAELGLELFEEPCAFTGLPSLASTGVAFGFDESLRDLDLRRVTPQTLSARGVKAVVLKPTLLGGIGACVGWAKRARSNGCAVILSHAFESTLGVAPSAALALALGSTELDQGLDLPEETPFFRDGQIVPWQTPGFGLEQHE